MKVIPTKYINVTLNNIDDSVSKYNNESLNEELSNYILRECFGTNNKANIIIRIKTLFNITEDNKNLLIDRIRSNYGNDIKENMIHIKQENIKKVVLMIIGILFVLISELSSTKNILIITEIFLIIGWLGIWEVFNSLIFIDTKLKMETKRLKQLTNCKIEFI